MNFVRLLICLFAPIGAASLVVSAMRSEWVVFSSLSQETQVVTLALSLVLLLDAIIGKPSIASPSPENEG